MKDMLKFWLKISRLIQVAIGGMTTWIISLLSSTSSGWIDVTKACAIIVIILSIWGASIWHYGARADVYAQKHWDLVIVKHPISLMIAGVFAFALSIIVAWIFLPQKCFLISVVNAIVILIYARVLDQYWPFKKMRPPPKKSGIVEILSVFYS